MTVTKAAGYPKTPEKEVIMDFRSFVDSTSAAEPPDGLPLGLQALWWDAKGDWDKAHQSAQQREDVAGNRVHAYLHRKEGDLPNAGYWYRRAGVAAVTGTLEAEWEMLVREFLAEG